MRALDLYRRRPVERANDTTAVSITDWSKMFAPGTQFSYNGRRYQGYQTGSPGSQGAGYYDTNPIVFSCATNRGLLFSEARFQFQQMTRGRPGDLFGNQDLGVLEEPWPGATTGDLLVQVDFDVTTCGNSYWVRDGDYLQWLDAQKMSILTEAAYDPLLGRRIGERLLAYAYRESPQDDPAIFLPTEIAHHRPYPSRMSRFVGMSWLNACLPDIDADQKITEHKQTTLVDGAQIPYVVNFDKDISGEAFLSFVQDYRTNHEGASNAGKTLFLGPGADIKTVGQTFENLAVKATQGAGESRIIMCSGIPAVLVGSSEGMAASTYSNAAQARRVAGDKTLRPLWRRCASAFRSVVSVPPGTRLWYDDRDIPFLRDDVKDLAEIKASEALTIRQLIDAGYEPDAAIDAVVAGDYRRLVGRHTGYFSVQLQVLGAQAPDTPPALPPAA